MKNQVKKVNIVDVRVTSSLSRSEIGTIYRVIVYGEDFKIGQKFDFVYNTGVSTYDVISFDGLRKLVDIPNQPQRRAEEVVISSIEMSYDMINGSPLQRENVVKSSSYENKRIQGYIC